MKGLAPTLLRGQAPRLGRARPFDMEGPGPSAWRGQALPRGRGLGDEIARARPIMLKYRRGAGLVCVARKDMSGSSQISPVRSRG